MPNQRPVLCLGKFDALHRGHRALVAVAAEHGQPYLLEFSGMAQALGWEPRPPLIAPMDRARILADWPGQPCTVQMPFAEVRQLDAAGFMVAVRERFYPAALVVGENFRGGYGRMADVHAFQEAGGHAGVPVIAVPMIRYGVSTISSTRIRCALESGDVAMAATCLGRPYRLTGMVTHGDGRGAKIGIPTANLGACANMPPCSGVYAAWAYLGTQRLRAAVNIGLVPTAGEGRPFTVEAHLLDWAGDCYGQQLALEFIERVRDERKFADFSELLAQIRQDIGRVRYLLPDQQ